MNVLEDLEREEVELPAKAVLFGNDFRLAEPSERPEQFTTKCQTAPQQNGTALIRTVELFYAAKYLAENENDAFLSKMSSNDLKRGRYRRPSSATGNVD
jgi:hypothetical protein